MKIVDVLIPIALLMNTILINRMVKRINNIEEWVMFLLEKDKEYRFYKEMAEKDNEQK